MSDRITTSTFIDACLFNRAAVSDVDDWVDRWHDSAGSPDGHPVSLEDYLGLTEEEYSQWMLDSSILRNVVVSRAYGIVGRTTQYIGGDVSESVEVAPNALLVH